MAQARLILTMLLVFLPEIGLAGPWPRGEGNQFLSLSIEAELENGITSGDEIFTGLFYERGLTQDLTLGFDLGTDPLGESKAFGFLRWPIRENDGPNRLALEVGFGALDGEPAIRPGLSWGRGFDRGDLAGWMSVETRLVLQEDFDSLLESDFTFGLRPGPRSLVIFQLQTGLPDDDVFFAKIAPSYVQQYKPGKWFELGLISGITGVDDFKFKLGLWREF